MTLALEHRYALHPVSHKSVNFFAYLHPEEHDEAHLPARFEPNNISVSSNNNNNNEDNTVQEMSDANERKEI